jgi:hypothetical protein
MLLDRYSQFENISPVFMSPSSVKELKINIMKPYKLFRSLYRYTIWSQSKSKEGYRCLRTDEKLHLTKADICIYGTIKSGWRKVLITKFLMYTFREML